MGEQLKRPYEISIWEDLLVNTEDGYSYYDENKIAVIGSDKMTAPNRVYSPVLKNNVNGERTLTFSMAYRYYDEEVGDFVMNPFLRYMVNERKVKLLYNDKWYDFIIKECEEDSENYQFNYTATDAFTNELAKTGYDVTFDTELNNNMGTVIDLAKKTLENTDWQVDEYNSDIIRQYISEPIYIGYTYADFDCFNVVDKDEQIITIHEGDIIYLFYSQITNEVTMYVHFLREGDESNIIDDKNAIKGNNYRFFDELIYELIEVESDGHGHYRPVEHSEESEEEKIYKMGLFIEEDEEKKLIVIIEDLDDYHQGYRLAYDQTFVYDPVMGRTVRLYKAVYDNDEDIIYAYDGYTYTNSTIVVSYFTSGTNFSVYTAGADEGWQNNCYFTDGQLHPFKMVTFPKLDLSQSLASLEQLDSIRSYLELYFPYRPNGSGSDNNYSDAYFNSGITDSAAILGNIAKGEKFVFRIRYGYLEVPSTSGYMHHVSVEDASIRAVVAGYTLEPCYLEDGSKIDVKKVDPTDIYLRFDGQFKVGNNVITGGYIDTESSSMYIIDNVVQTPSLQYIYYDALTSEYYTWDPIYKIYKLYDEDTFSNYLYVVAEAEKGLSHSELANIANRIGIFLYDENDREKYVYVESVELFRFVDGGEDEEGNPIPVFPGDAPTAQTNPITHYYLKPTEGMTQDQVNTYLSLESLADDVGIDVYTIDEVRNEQCEKYLSIEESKSNCFNILQSLCETFQCWLDIRVEHNSDGSIKLDEEYKPIKRVAFKEYIGKENFAGFKYGINLKSIARTLDSNEFVTKLYVGEPSNDYVEGGTLSIANAFSNPSKESYILNLNYYLNQGLIQDRLECMKDISQFNIQLSDINNELIDTRNEYIQASTALVKVGSNRNVFIETYDKALEEYAKALTDFQIVTNMTYEQYIEHEEEHPEIIQNETILGIIGRIYSMASVINQYAGIVTNIKAEYRELDLLVNGAQTYNLVVSTVPEDGAQNGKTTLTISDFVEGFECRFFVGDEEPDIFTPTVNKKSYLANRPYEYIEISKLPEGYYLQYSEVVDDYSLTQDTEVYEYKTYYKWDNDLLEYVEVEDPVEFRLTELNPYDNPRHMGLYEIVDGEYVLTMDASPKSGKDYYVRELNFYYEVTGHHNETVTVEEVYYTIFEIYDTFNNEGMVKRFSLVPSSEYEEEHIGFKQWIEILQKEKEEITREFNSKYSRYIQEGTWESNDYVDPELYYYDAVQVSNTSAQPKVSYTINVLEISEIEGFENYLFDVGDKTYIEDTEFFGYNEELIAKIIDEETGERELISVKTPVKEEVVVSEVEWHLDEPWDNVVTVQNYKTQFEDLFQRISAAVQSLNYNQASYSRAASIFDERGNIRASILANSLEAIASTETYGLVANGVVRVVEDGILITDLVKVGHQLMLKSGGFETTTDGGLTWKKVLTPEGINADTITAGTINTNEVMLMDGESPSFRWDTTGINAYGRNEYGYDLTTFVRFDRFGLYGVKNGENYVFNSLKDIKDKAHFGVTWNGFFIKNSYTDGYVSISSDNDFQVVRKINGIDVEKIKIGALEFDIWGQPTKYGINIKNDSGNVVMTTGDDGNLTITGTINAYAGIIGGMVVDQNKLSMKSIVLEPGVGIYSTKLTDSGEPIFKISDEDGSSSFNNIMARGEINATSGNFTGEVTVGKDSEEAEKDYIIIDGDNALIQSSTYSPTSNTGWVINSAGDATFSNVSVRGAIKTAVFEYAEIEAVGGAFLFRPSSTIRTAEFIGEDYDSGAVYESGASIYELKLTVENPQLFRVGEWCKVSNYAGEVNSGYAIEGEESPTSVITGLTYVYQISSIVDGVITLTNVDLDMKDNLESLPGGALISFGFSEDSEDYDEGKHNYGIGINSSDNYINLPERAITLFESRIQKDESIKVRYDHKAILGTLVDLDYEAIDGREPKVSKLYHDNLAGTQGIYTDNIYFGNDKEYVTFYTNKDDKKKYLEINSDKFKLKDGVIEATGGTLAGITIDSKTLYTETAYIKLFDRGRGYMFMSLMGAPGPVNVPQIAKIHTYLVADIGQVGYSQLFRTVITNGDDPDRATADAYLLRRVYKYDATSGRYVQEPDDSIVLERLEIDTEAIREYAEMEITLPLTSPLAWKLSEAHMAIVEQLYESVSYTPFDYSKFEYYKENDTRLVLPFINGFYIGIDTLAKDIDLTQAPEHSHEGYEDDEVKGHVTNDRYNIIAGGPITAMRITAAEEKAGINQQRTSPIWWFRSDGSARIGSMSLSSDGKLDLPSLATITVNLGVMDQGIIKHDTVGQEDGLWISTDDIKPYEHILSDSGSTYWADYAKDAGGVQVAGSPFTFAWRLIMGKQFGVTSDGIMYSQGARVSDLRTKLNDTTDTDFMNKLVDFGFSNEKSLIEHSEEDKVIGGFPVHLEWSYLDIKNISQDFTLTRQVNKILPKRMGETPYDGWFGSVGNLRYRLKVDGVKAEYTIIVSPIDSDAKKYSAARIRCKDVIASYEITTDTEIDTSKTYFIKKTTLGTEKYVIVWEPKVEDIDTYYEYISYLEFSCATMPTDELEVNIIIMSGINE